MLRVGARDSVVPVAGASGDKMSFSSSARFSPEFYGGFREFDVIWLTGAGVLWLAMGVLLTGAGVLRDIA